MRGVVAPVLACLFDIGVGAYIVGRMWRTMAHEAFWTAVFIEALALGLGFAGMVGNGYGITLMLVVLGLAETAIVVSTWGRVEVFFNTIAEPDHWTSRRATVVALRFCAVALVLGLAATPLLLKLA